jgi:hypothetical protein
MKIVSTIISILLIISLGYVSFKTYENAIKYNQKLKEEIMVDDIHKKISTFKNKIRYEVLELNKHINKIKNEVESFISLFINSQRNKTIKQSNITKKDTQKIKIAQKDHTSNYYKNKQTKYFIIYLCLIVVILLSYFISTIELFAFTVLTGSFISLCVGVFAPIMTLEVFSDLPVLGNTVFKYEEKSIFDTIKNLWFLNNYAIALGVGLFSIVVPLVKTIAMYITILYKKDIKHIDYIGKWSMADVFIVALLLSNLSLNADKFTKAELQIGIYFFLIYVIQSILVSIIIKSRIK